MYLHPAVKEWPKRLYLRCTRLQPLQPGSTVTLCSEEEWLQQLKYHKDCRTVAAYDTALVTQSDQWRSQQRK